MVKGKNKLVAKSETLEEKKPKPIIVSHPPSLLPKNKGSSENKKKFKESQTHEKSNNDHEKKRLKEPPIISSIFYIDLSVMFSRNFEVPLLDRMRRTDGIELLGEMLGMTDLDYNLASYWTLDVISQVIKKCQKKKMNEENQKISIVWIVYILMAIRQYGFKRVDLFRHLCMLFIRGLRALPDLANIPDPFELQLQKYELEEDSDTEEEDAESYLEEEVEAEEEESVETSAESDSRGQSDVSTAFTVPSLGDMNLNEEEDLSNLDSLLQEEIQENIKSMFDYIDETRRANDKDFHQLIIIIYRTFANRFKFAVIWKAFVEPPKLRTIRIMQNFKIPKKARSTRPIVKTGKGKKFNRQKFSKGSSARQKVSKATSVNKSSTRVKKRKRGKKRFKPLVIKNLLFKKKFKKKKSKYIRPLVEAVNLRFLYLVGQYQLKQIKYRQYLQSVAKLRRIFKIKNKKPKVIRKLVKKYLEKVYLKKKALNERKLKRRPSKKKEV